MKRRGSSKAPKCPTCEKKMVRIVYGLPDPELFERAERKEVILGGCIPEPVRWGCWDCPPDPLSDESLGL